MPKHANADEDESMSDGAPSDKHRFKFTPDVNAGHVLTAISMIVGISISGGVGYATAQSSRAVLEYRMGQVEGVQKQLADTQTRLSEAMTELQKSNVRLLAIQELLNREQERRKP